jgi:translation initiation factor 2B subunit (eIF-2B alpha/beta/delta family)
LENVPSSKKEISTKNIIKMLNNEGIYSLNEEVILTLLKLSKNGLSKQGMLCSELIQSIKILIETYPADDKNEMQFLNEVRDKVSKIINCVYKLTTVIGGLDNSCTYIKKVLNKVATSYKNVPEIKEMICRKIEEFIHTKIDTKRIISSSNRGLNLIKEGDCLMIYGKSKIFRNILQKAVDSNINFKVIFVDNVQENHSIF